MVQPLVFWTLPIRHALERGLQVPVGASQGRAGTPVGASQGRAETTVGTSLGYAGSSVVRFSSFVRPGKPGFFVL